MGVRGVAVGERGRAFQQGFQSHQRLSGVQDMRKLGGIPRLGSVHQGHGKQEGSLRAGGSQNRGGEWARRRQQGYLGVRPCRHRHRRRGCQGGRGQGKHGNGVIAVAHSQETGLGPASSLSAAQQRIKRPRRARRHLARRRQGRPPPPSRRQCQHAGMPVAVYCQPVNGTGGRGRAERVAWTSVDGRHSVHPAPAGQGGRLPQGHRGGRIKQAQLGTDAWWERERGGVAGRGTAGRGGGDGGQAAVARRAAASPAGHHPFSPTPPLLPSHPPQPRPTHPRAHPRPGHCPHVRVR